MEDRAVVMPQGQRRTMARLLHTGQSRVDVSNPAAETSKKPSAPVAPIEEAGLFSQLTFRWLNSIFETAYKSKSLSYDVMKRLQPLAQKEDAALLTDRLTVYWEAEINNATTAGRAPNFLKSVFLCFWKILLFSGFWGFTEACFQVSQSVFLGLLVGSLTNVDITQSYLFAMGLSLCTLGYGITHHIFFFMNARAGMQMRVACTGMIVRKALTLSQASIASTSSGHIVNLVSGDVQRFDYFMVQCHFLWLGPLTAVVTYLVYRYVGWAVFIGLSFLLLFIPLQVLIGKGFAILRGLTAKLTDSRVKQMAEVITGMRVIKMYAWETFLIKQISGVRANEMKNVKKTGFLRAFTLAFFFVSMTVVSFLTFMTFYLSGGVITPQIVFGTISLLSVVRFGLAFFFPAALANLAELIVSMKRVQEFLQFGEHKRLPSVAGRNESVVSNSRSHPPTSKLQLIKGRKSSAESFHMDVLNAVVEAKEPASIHLRNVSCAWSETSLKNTLTDISFDAVPGQLCAVVGKVGSGKSSLLMAIMNEMKKTAGDFTVKGSLAYSAQEPWILAGTVRENILFGLPFDEEWYAEVVECCALSVDIQNFPEGDLSEIGERGITLSGGQRARLSLARAVYSRADIYLLDDPLSAVDTTVGRMLYDFCIRGVLRERVVVLVTHQVQYLSSVGQVIVMEDGKIKDSGSYVQLLKRGHDFHALMDEEDESSEDEDSRTTTKKEAVDAKKSLAEDRSAPIKRTVAGSVSLEGTNIGTSKQVKAEMSAEGAVSWVTYKAYFSAAGGLPVMLFLVIFMCAGQGASQITDWWLSHWSSLAATDTSPVNLGIYGGLCALNIAVAFGRAFLFIFFMILGGERLHNRMFDHMIRAPMFFFDANPSGRILNRFSKDTGFMDDLLPMTLLDAVQSFLMCIGAVLLVAIINPWVFLAVIPIMVLFILLRRYYMITAREIKRVEGTSRSPMYGHLSASLRGLPTIRAFNQSKRFAAEFHAMQNSHGIPWFLFIGTSRWLGFRLDMLSFAFVAASSLLIVVAHNSIGPGLAGLSLTYCIQLTGLFQWMIRQSAEVESLCTSVERIVEYTTLPSEAPWVNEYFVPPTWPDKGRIEFDQCTLCYSEGLAPVLRNLTFTVEAGEKVGIVGRTGAGKSSILVALFRLAEYSGGRILIDGICTKDIGLHTLRGSISVIPQEPVLFSASIRKNVDPFDEHSDEMVWDALQAVQLDVMVKALKNGLDDQLAESGSNLSVGERQLICLARAILKKCKILVMDEATANVDLTTDALIQRTIRERFAACTVLTIAHRLNTIMDSDRVLVLNAGEVVEYGPPHELLLSPGSHLAYLVDELNKGSKAAVIEQAWVQFQRKNSLVDGTALWTAV